METLRKLKLKKSFEKIVVDKKNLSQVKLREREQWRKAKQKSEVTDMMRE